MPKGRRLGAEQIVTKLRQIEVMQGQGKSIAVACKEAGITEQCRCVQTCETSSLIAREGRKGDVDEHSRTRNPT